MDDDTWTIDVTDDDVRAARLAWRAAEAAGAEPTRVAELYGGLERLVRTQARQLAEELRRAAEERPAR